MKSNQLTKKQAAALIIEQIKSETHYLGAILLGLILIGVATIIFDTLLKPLILTFVLFMAIILYFFEKTRKTKIKELKQKYGDFN